VFVLIVAPFFSILFALYITRFMIRMSRNLFRRYRQHNQLFFLAAFEILVSSGRTVHAPSTR
jgi:hypothetical protein